MEPTEIKGLAIAVLFILAFISGLLPLCCIKHNRDGSNFAENTVANRIIGLLNSVAGGIFLSIALVHLTPEVRVMFVNSFESLGKDYDFEWAGFTIAMGFFLVTFIEQLAMVCVDRSDSRRQQQDQEESVLIETNNSETETNYGTVTEKKTPIESDGRISDANSASDTPSNTDHDHHQSSFRAVILLVSLMIHSVLEGLAVGLQLTAADTVDLFVAIAIHKPLESFTVLLQFAQTVDKVCLKYGSLVMFSLASPIGVAIGIPLANVGEGEEGEPADPDAMLVNAILQGLATGTFIFVTFLELLPHQLTGKNDRMVKFICLLAGFGLMSGLTKIAA